MQTFVKVWFNSEGAPATTVTDRLMSMGFRPVTGKYDYAYDWKRKPEIEDILQIGDQVKQTLSGCNVTYKLETE